MFFNEKIIINKILINAALLSIIFSTLYLSFEYSYYNTDFHHWSFILEKYYQFINDQPVFKSIYIQYGEGYIWFFYILSFFTDIDLVSIGKITGVIYALKLFLIYFISKCLTKNSYISLFILLIYFLTLTHIQYPWPDFFSSFFLLLFFFLIIINNRKKNNFFLLLSSSSLFLVFFFRSTYIFNIFFSFLLYFIIEFIFLKKEPKIRLVFIFFLIFFLLYIFKLYIDDNLKFFFSQSLYLAHDFIATNQNLILSFEVNKYIYLLSRVIWHLFYPKNIFFFVFSLIYFINIYYLFFLLNLYRKKDSFFENTNLIILFFFFGLTSTIQAIHLYEVFRLLNAGPTIFIILSIFFLDKRINLIFRGTFFILLIILVIKLIPQFPKSSNYHIPTSNISSEKLHYEINYNNNLFGKKKLLSEYIFFYNQLREKICPFDNILNISIASELSFFCEKKKNIIKVFPLAVGHQKRSLEEINQFKKSNYNQNLLIITSTELSNYKFFYKIKLPKFYRFTRSDSYMSFWHNEIYLYNIIWP
jgi:hypothetical protein